MRTEVQKELDRVEEYVLNKLFDNIENPKLSLKIRTAMAIKGVNFADVVNENIEVFEEFMQDYMREDGFLDVEKIEKIISTQYPILDGLKLPLARPIEYIKLIELFIPLEKVAGIIENF